MKKNIFISIVLVFNNLFFNFIYSHDDDEKIEKNNKNAKINIKNITKVHTTVVEKKDEEEAAKLQELNDKLNEKLSGLKDNVGDNIIGGGKDNNQYFNNIDGLEKILKFFDKQNFVNTMTNLLKNKLAVEEAEQQKDSNRNAYKLNERYNFLNTIIDSPHLLDFIDSGNENLLNNIFEQKIKLKGDPKTRDLSQMYDELIKNKEFISLIQKTNPRLLEIINNVFKYWKEVKKETRNNIEDTFIRAYKDLKYYLATDSMVKFCKQNKSLNKLNDSIKVYIKRNFDLAKVNTILNKNPGNKKYITQLKKDAKDGISKTQNKLMIDKNNIEKTIEGAKDKGKNCGTMSCKPERTSMQDEDIKKEEKLKT